MTVTSIKSKLDWETEGTCELAYTSLMIL